MNMHSQVAPNAPSPQLSAWSHQKQFSGPVDPQMNVHPPVDNSNYNPLRELATLDYPPAAEVGRGRYKHLYTKGGVFGSTSSSHPKSRNSGQNASQNPNTKGPRPSDSHFAPPMYGNPNGYGRSANTYNRNARYPTNTAYLTDPAMPPSTPYPPSYHHPHGSMPGDHHGEKGPRGYPNPPLGPGGAPLQGYPPMYHTRGYHGHGHQHGKGGKGQPRILSRFKTRLCSFYMDSNGAFCPHGTSNDCQFAHGYEELRLPGVNGQPSTPLPPHILAELSRANNSNSDGNSDSSGSQNASETSSHMAPRNTPPTDSKYAPNSAQPHANQHPPHNGHNSHYPSVPHTYHPGPLPPPPGGWNAPSAYPAPHGNVMYPNAPYYPAAGSPFYNDPMPPCSLPTPPTSAPPSGSVGDPSSSNNSPVVKYNIPETYTAPPGPQSVIPGMGMDNDLSRVRQNTSTSVTPVSNDARSFTGSVHSAHSEESHRSGSLLSPNLPSSPQSSSTTSEVGSLGLPMPADAVNALANDLSTMSLGLSPRSVPKSGTSPLYLPENHNIPTDDGIPNLSLFSTNGELSLPDRTADTESTGSPTEVDLLAQKEAYHNANSKEEENVTNNSLMGPML